MLQAVHDEAIVDFVGEDDELVLARDVDDLLEHFLWVKCAGGVVRVDDDNRLGVAGDLGADVVDVRIPFGLFVAQVVHGGAAGQVHAGGPQRVVRGWHEHFVAGVE